MKDKRCPWCGTDPLYQRYHDDEWGVPCNDDGRLFEFLTLEAAQAGLSWITILRKRDAYRAAFAGFDAHAVAAFDRRDVERLMGNAGIVRNRLKIEAAISNARLFLETRAQHGSFSAYLWNFVDGRPVQNRWRSMQQVPATTPLSDTISKDMKKRGFRFFGSTICYAHLQATGV
ncbi:MAG TPA: DNA-3-methyladenine glycosylase I, partial [Spongiibacteraceae bacterium]|nr:DNA-3-methyladenine glycosylase I [Spongiibacteraceae bacterium]